MDAFNSGMNETELRQQVDIKIEREDRQSDILALEVLESLASGAERVHWLLVETNTSLRQTQVESVRYTDATIHVRATYLFGDASRLRPGDLVSDMGGRVTSHDQSIRITNGGVMVDEGLRDMHVGTFLFHKIVSWASEFDPLLRVVPIRVIAGDAGPRNGPRRNKFYANFGVRFIWSQEEKEGISDSSLTIGDLVAYQNWPNIRVHRRLTPLQQLWRTNERLRREVRGSRNVGRYHRKHYQRIEARLRTIALLLSWPLFVLLAVGGFILGMAYRTWSDAGN